MMTKIIKLRETYICDYLLITTNKTKSEIFNELKKKTFFKYKIKIIKIFIFIIFILYFIYG